MEDTNPYIPRDIRVLATMLDTIPLAGTQKLENLKSFLRKYDEFYAVDSFFTNFYSYNCSWMWHRFIQRMNLDVISYWFKYTVVAIAVYM